MTMAENRDNEELTIVIPMWNREGTIGRCLDSVRDQTYRPLRVLVVDNNSTDGSVGMVREWMEGNTDDTLKVELLSEKRQGAAAAREKGLDETRTRIVAFFDSDDTMRPDYAETIMEGFRNPSDPDIVTWRVCMHRLGGRVVTSHGWDGKDAAQHLVHAVLMTLCYAVRTEFIRSCGGWNPEVRVWDDWELGVRLLLNSPKVKTFDRVTADVWSQEESITGVSFSAKYPAWDRILDLTEEIVRQKGRADARRWLRVIDYRRMILAADYSKEGSHEYARGLCADTLSNGELTPLNRLALRFAYAYTRRRLRGAFRLVSLFLY